MADAVCVGADQQYPSVRPCLTFQSVGSRKCTTGCGLVYRDRFINEAIWNHVVRVPLMDRYHA